MFAGAQSSKMLQNIKSDTLFSFIDETEEGKKKKSSVIKNLSTGYIAYSQLYNTTTVQLRTRSKLIIASNHPLNFSDDDTAIRNRILYIKFNRKFSEFESEVGTVLEGVTVEKGQNNEQSLNLSNCYLLCSWSECQND